jgi:hypothetical protein
MLEQTVPLKRVSTCQYRIVTTCSTSHFDHVEPLGVPVTCYITRGISTAKLPVRELLLSVVRAGAASTPQHCQVLRGSHLSGSIL